MPGPKQFFNKRIELMFSKVLQPCAGFISGYLLLCFVDLAKLCLAVLLPRDSTLWLEHLTSEHERTEVAMLISDLAIPCSRVLCATEEV